MAVNDCYVSGSALAAGDLRSPLSLPQGLAGFWATKSHLFFTGAKAVKPPTRGRGRLNQQSGALSPEFAYACGSPLNEHAQ